MLITFEQVAEEAGVSRALVHAYVGDRRGLIDAVQVRIISRMDTWVGHGLRRADSPTRRLQSLATSLFAFVDAERDPWGVLVASGGLDHPALHGVRSRWCDQLTVDDHPGDLGVQAAVAALVLGVGGWVNRGVEPADVLVVLRRLLPDP